MGATIGSDTTASTRAATQEVHAAIKLYRDFIADLFDKATTYNKIIVGAGYAGFFTAWVGTKELLTPFLRVLSVALVLVSLFLYVFFEVFQMLFISITLVQANKTAYTDPSKFTDEIKKYKRKQGERGKWFIRIWSVVYWPTLVTAFAGGLVLIVAFALRLVRSL